MCSGAIEATESDWISTQRRMENENIFEDQRRLWFMCFNINSEFGPEFVQVNKLFKIQYLNTTILVRDTQTFHNDAATKKALYKFLQ